MADAVAPGPRQARSMPANQPSSTATPTTSSAAPAAPVASVASASTGATGRILALDVLRGIAILGTLASNIWLFSTLGGPAAWLSDGFATDDPDVRLYDVFYDNTDPRKVFLEMDVYWAFVGQHRYPGFEPVDYVKRNPHRYPLLHLKDGDANPANTGGYDIVEFGAGDLPYTEFLSALAGSGRRHGIWEQDNAATVAAPGFPVDSFGNAERSYVEIRSLRAERC